MPLKKTRNSQPARRSTRCKKANIPETSSDSGMISWSPTPTWPTDTNPDHSGDVCQHAELKEPQPLEDQPEEDEFFPTTQEVAAMLVAMRLRHSKLENRGHEVCPQIQQKLAILDA